MLISQIAPASEKLNRSIAAAIVIEDNALSKNQVFSVDGSGSISSSDNSSQRQCINNTGNCSSSNLAGKHPIMHPSKVQMAKWIGMYTAAPGAYLSTQVGAKLSRFSGAHYSLLSYLQYVPSERNQGRCGDCWAWAGTGVMEIDNAYRNGAKDRLSVQYLNSNIHNGIGSSWACCGGWLDDLADFYATTKILVPWSNTNAQWRDGSRSCEDGSTSVLPSAISTNPHYNLTSINAVSIPTHGVGKEAAIANIKNVLNQGRAIWFGYFLPDNNGWNDFFSFWDTRRESDVWKPDSSCGKAYNYNQGGGHAVLCVGYDDTDPHNRYWIMLNSWGASYNRPNGLFLVNMDMNYDCTYASLGYAFYWMTLDINYANALPAVPSVPAGPASGYAGNSYTYSTSAVDPNGYQVKYTFDWGDGTNSTTDLVRSGITASASHTWSSNGVYRVKAQAIDSSGASSGWSGPLNVAIAANSPPNLPVKPAGPSSGYVGASYTYTTSAVDPNGYQVKYTFDWGDGTNSTTDLVGPGVNTSASHVWSASGIYPVKAMAMNSNGASSEWSSPFITAISVNYPPNKPSVPLGPSSGRKQVAYTYSTYAKDPNGDQVKYTFDWGDGTYFTTDLINSGTNASAQHSWSATGMHPIRVKAMDGSGASSGWTSPLIVAIAANSPPDVPTEPFGSKSGTVASIYSYSTFAADPDGNRIKYTFDWGDGTTSATGMIQSGINASKSHAWSGPGIYQVRANATDESGVSSGWSDPLNVAIDANVPPNTPIIPVGHSSGSKRVAYIFSTYAKDLNGDRVKYTLDWGDGTRSETGLVKSGKIVRLSHKWSASGTYDVRAMTTDSIGISSGWSSPKVVKII